MLHLENFGSSDSAIAGVILQMGLMPAAIVMPNLSNRLKATEQDIILKRTITTFQTIIREKEEEIFLLEQKLSLCENSASSVSGRTRTSGQTDADQQIAKKKLAASITKLVSTLYTSKSRDEASGPNKDDLIETLDKMRVCLRTIQGISDEDWQAVLEPVGDTLLSLQTEQLRKGSISSMLDRISSTSQTNLYSNAQYMELERSINAAAVLEDSDDQTLDGEQACTLPENATRQELFERAFATGSAPLTDSELEILAESINDEYLNRLLALRATKCSNRTRLDESQTLNDSGNASPHSASLNQTNANQFYESNTKQPDATTTSYVDATGQQSSLNAALVNGQHAKQPISQNAQADPNGTTNANHNGMLHLNSNQFELSEANWTSTEERGSAQMRMNTSATNGSETTPVNNESEHALHVARSDLKSNEICNALQLAMDIALIDLLNGDKSQLTKSAHDTVECEAQSLSAEQAARLFIALQNKEDAGCISDIQNILRACSSKSVEELQLELQEKLHNLAENTDVQSFAGNYEQLRKNALLLQLSVLHFADPNTTSPLTTSLAAQLQYLRAAESSGIDTQELDKQVRGSLERTLHALNTPAASADLLARMVTQSCMLLKELDTAQNTANADATQTLQQGAVDTRSSATRNIDLEAQVHTLLEARSQQSARIRELEALIETYRVTATQLNRNLSRDITALSYISDDSRSFLQRPATTYKQQQGVDRDVRGSTASLQLDLSRSDSVNFSAIDTEGEVRTYDKFDVHINVQLDAGKVEAQVRLIECERIIQDLQNKIASFTQELQDSERCTRELALKDREIEQLRSKLQDMVQVEATLKKQIGVLTDTIAAMREQKGSIMQEQIKALAKAEVSGKLELVDLNAERHRLYEASRADGATIHKLQLTARELDLTNRKLKSQLDSFQSSQSGLLREIGALKDTIEDLSIQLDEVRLQCASWQRKASNYRRIAANIMSKLGSYKQQIRGLVLARLSSSQSGGNFDIHLSRSSLAILDEDETETFHIIESLEN